MIDPVDDHSQSGPLSRTGGNGHQHRAVSDPREFLRNRRQPKVGKPGNLTGHDSQHRPDGALLHVDVHAESADPFNLETRIQFPLLFEVLLLFLRERLVYKAMDGAWVQQLGAGGFQLAAYTEGDRTTGFEVDV